MRRLLILAAAFPAGCATVLPAPKPMPEPKDIRSAPKSFLEELIVRRKSGGVTLRIYDTGRVRTRGAAVSSMKSWRAKVALEAPAFLIRHPEQGLILFDAGLSSETARRLNRGLVRGWFAKFESAPGRDVVSQLRADGEDPARVRWVILSHLHLDHAGMAGAFPEATVIVSRREWEWWKARQARKKDDGGVVPEELESRWKLRLVDLEAAPPFGTFDRGLDLFSDGVLFLVDLPGHTPGSMGAWVNLDGGPVLLAGDASWVVDNHMDLALPVERAIADAEAYWRTLHMIRAAQEAAPRLVVFPGHDLSPRTLTDRDDLPLAGPSR